jgi:hypothetical protein
MKNIIKAMFLLGISPSGAQPPSIGKYPKSPKKNFKNS